MSLIGTDGDKWRQMSLDMSAELVLLKIRFRKF